MKTYVYWVERRARTGEDAWGYVGAESRNDALKAIRQRHPGSYISACRLAK